MRISFTAKGPDWDSEMDLRFGRAEYLLVYDEATEEFSSYDNGDLKNQAHGAGPKTAQKLFEMKADILLTGNGPGGNAAGILKKAGVVIYTGTEEVSVRQAYDAYKNNKLNKLS